MQFWAQILLTRSEEEDIESNSWISEVAESFSAIILTFLLISRLLSGTAEGTAVNLRFLELDAPELFVELKKLKLR